MSQPTSILRLIIRILLILCICVGIYLLVVWIHYSVIQPAGNATSSPMPYTLYIYKFISNHPFTIGVASGLVGIFVAFGLLGARFTISPELAMTNTNKILVQVRNDFFLCKVIDMTIELDYIRYLDGGKNTRTKRIALNKNSLSVLYGRCYGPAKCHYTFHTADPFVWDNKYDAIRCRISGLMEISNIKRIKEVFYTPEQVKRGELQNGKYVPQKYLYPTKYSKLWSKEIEQRCQCLWKANDAISRAISATSVAERAQTIVYIDNACDQIKLLQTPEYKSIFPCLNDNQDAVRTILDELLKLRGFWTIVTNLNPANKEQLNKYTKIISTYTLYISRQLDNDIARAYRKEVNTL